MTIEQFSQTRFGAGMQVRINKTGVAYHEGEFYTSLDDLNWFHCEWVEIVNE
jgi:hypothetical protein